MHDRFRIEIDPGAIEESMRQLRDRALRAVDQGRYTKVRLKYKGKPVAPDIPLAALIAMEGASLLVTGPLQVLLLNLGVKAFIEVEFLHEASERVREGVELFTAGEADAAEAKYREALSMNAEDPSAWYNLGVLLRITGRRDEALAAFEAAAKSSTHADGVRAAEALEKMRKGPRNL